MRAHRHRNLMDDYNQERPSTSDLEDQERQDRLLGRAQRRFHHHKRSPNYQRRRAAAATNGGSREPPAELAAGDELFFIGAESPADSVSDTGPPLQIGASRLYGATSASNRNASANSSSTTSVIVFAFALSGILLVFLLFYFLAKVCSPSDEEELKASGANESMGSGLNIRRAASRKLANGVHDSPRHVLYPRRIYELQAEEGCYTSLPSMQVPENISDDVVTLKQPGRGKRNFRRLVRKLTTSSAPTSQLYTPSDTPRFSTCSNA